MTFCSGCKPLCNFHNSEGALPFPLSPCHCPCQPGAFCWTQISQGTGQCKWNVGDKGSPSIVCLDFLLATVRLETFRAGFLGNAHVSHCTVGHCAAQDLTVPVDPGYNRCSCERWQTLVSVCSGSGHQTDWPIKIQAVQKRRWRLHVWPINIVEASPTRLHRGGLRMARGSHCCCGRVVTSRLANQHLGQATTRMHFTSLANIIVVGALAASRGCAATAAASERNDETNDIAETPDVKHSALG